MPTKTNFLDLAKTRKTTYEYERKDVSDADIGKVIEAGRWAPSCSNSQPWRFIIVRNRKTITALIDSSSYGGFHTNPPVLIAVALEPDCVSEDEHRCVKNNKLGKTESMLCIGMAALSLVFEAHDLGLSSAIITPNIDTAARWLRTKKGQPVPLFVALGHERKGTFQKKRERKKMQELISYERYGHHHERR
ncbi:nitroreductase family protein [Candidatus Woesearchaeota archaeon]|nr:nitroreductase family protein [Candidatus Woesearchaeota archaeon]